MPNPHAVLKICKACLDPNAGGVEAVRVSMRHAGLTIDIELSPCLEACDPPSAIALQGAGLATYVFAGVDLEEHADDVAAACAAYLAAPKGWIEDARPCGALRYCLRARLPAAD